MTRGDPCGLEAFTTLNRRMMTHWLMVVLAVEWKVKPLFLDGVPTAGPDGPVLDCFRRYAAVRGQGKTRQFRIGELAAELGLNPKTIRYYEQIGLLPVQVRTSSGYRVYGPADQDRLRFIGKAKAIGLSLKEIGEILELRVAGERPCEHVVQLLDRKLVEVEAEVRALTDFKQDLVAMREEAVDTSTAEACVCGIIEHHVTLFRGAVAGTASGLLSRQPQRRR